MSRVSSSLSYTCYPLLNRIFLFYLNILFLKMRSFGPLNRQEVKRTNNKHACDDCKKSHRKCIEYNTSSNCCYECNRKGIYCEFRIQNKKRGRPIGTLNKKKGKKQM